MLYVKFENGKAVETSSECQTAPEWQSRWEWHREGFAHVQRIVAELNTAAGRQIYVATDAGEHCSPRYDVAEIPEVGAAVSYAFNGDSYPDGIVVKISASLRVIQTSTGNKYYRRRLTGAWVRNGTWSLVAGRHYKQNPSF